VTSGVVASTFPAAPLSGPPVAASPPRGGTPCTELAIGWVCRGQWSVVSRHDEGQPCAKVVIDLPFLALWHPSLDMGLLNVEPGVTLGVNAHVEPPWRSCTGCGRWGIGHGTPLNGSGSSPRLDPPIRSMGWGGCRSRRCGTWLKRGLVLLVLIRMNRTQIADVPVRH